MSETELKPCIRCGGELTIHENDWCVPSEWLFQCAGCGLSGKQWPTEAEAIMDANRRPSQARRVAMERAAKVADDLRVKLSSGEITRLGKGTPEIVACNRIAAGIRALIVEEPDA